MNEELSKVLNELVVNKWFQMFLLGWVVVIGVKLCGAICEVASWIDARARREKVKAELEEFALERAKKHYEKIDEEVV